MGRWDFGTRDVLVYFMCKRGETNKIDNYIYYYSYYYIYYNIYNNMFIILSFLKTPKRPKVPRPKVPNRGVFYLLNSTLFFCIFSPKNTPQKWLFLGYFFDSLRYFSYLCIVNTKEKNNALTSEKNFPSARGSLEARRRF